MGRWGGELELTLMSSFTPSRLPHQITYTHLESFADKTISYVVPFYSEIKMAVLLWMLASRTLVRPRLGRSRPAALAL